MLRHQKILLIRVMKLLKRLLCFFILIMLLGFSACSSEKSHPDESYRFNNSSSPNVILSVDEIGRKFGREKLILSASDGSIRQVAKIGNNMFFYVVSTEGSAVVYEQTEDNRIVPRLQFQTTQDVFSVCEGLGDDIPILSINQDGRYSLKKYRGDVLYESLDLPWLDEYENNMILECAVVSNGIIVITMSDVLLLNSDGSLRKNIGPYIMSASCMLKENGSIVIARGVPNDIEVLDYHTEITIVDAHLREVSTFSSEMQFEAFYENLGEENTILAKSVNTLFEFNYVTNSRKALIDLYSSCLSPFYIKRVEENVYLCVNRSEAAYWEPSDHGTREVLTLGAYNLNYTLDALIQEYNQYNSQFEIKVLDYATLNVSQNDDSGLIRLQADIICGNTPDILDLSNLPAEKYARAGLFADIEDLFSDDINNPLVEILPNIKAALKERGKLCYLMPSFSILVTYCDQSITDINNHWLNDDFFKLSQEYLPQQLFGPEMTREKFLALALLFNEQGYCNKQKAQCDFLNTDFKCFLEYATELPEKEVEVASQAWARAYLGDQKVIVEWLGSHCLSQIAFANAVFSGDAQFVGFPSSYNSGFAIVPSSMIGISNTSNNIEGAKDFAKFIISDPIQSGGLIPDFPVSQYGLDNKIALWATQYESSPNLLNTYYNGAVFQIKGDTETDEALQCVREIISNADVLALFDDSLFQIVMTECHSYFHGTASLEKTINSIQSKVQIYLSEQFG